MTEQQTRTRIAELEAQKAAYLDRHYPGLRIVPASTAEVQAFGALVDECDRLKASLGEYWFAIPGDRDGRPPNVPA